MPLIGKNMILGPALKISGWRKVAIGTWATAADPSVYGVLDIEVEAALRYLDKIKAKTDVKLTLSHFCGRVLAEVIRRHPDINCVLRFGRLYPRKNVDVFFQVATDMK